MARGRRVRRVVRKIDTWSVLKVSMLFFVTFTLVLILAGVLLWLAGSSIGIVTSVESFMQAIGFEDFRFVGSQLLRGFIAAGLVIVVLGTGSSVLMSVVYNLISDLVGGIQVTVLEEDTRDWAPDVASRDEDDAEISEAAGAHGGIVYDPTPDPTPAAPAAPVAQPAMAPPVPFSPQAEVASTSQEPASKPDEAGGYPERSVAGL